MALAGLLLLAVACSGPKANVSTSRHRWGTAPPSHGNTAPAAAPLARSIPVSIAFPAIGVSAPVMQLSQNIDGTLQVPPLSNLNLAGW